MLPAYQVVDRFLPVLASCVHDKHALVRRHAVMLLTHLLAEDFVRWRAVIFFHFATALADDNVEVREFAKAAFSGVLLAKAPTLFASHFVDTVIVLAACHDHPAYSHLAHALDGYSLSRVQTMRLFVTSMLTASLCMFTATATLACSCQPAWLAHQAASACEGCGCIAPCCVP